MSANKPTSSKHTQKKRASNSHELMSKILLESRQVTQLNEKLAEQLRISQQTTNKLKQDISKLQNEYEELTTNARVKFLEQELKEKDADVERANTKRKELADFLDARDSQISKLTEEINSLRNRISTKEVVIGELGKNLKIKDEDIESQELSRQELSGELSKLNQELDGRTKSLEDVHNSLGNLETSLEVKDDRLKRFEKEKQIFSNELKRVQNDNDELRKRLRVFEHNFSILKENLGNKDVVLNDTRRQFMERSKRLKKLSSDYLALQEKLRVLDSTNKELLKRLAKSDSLMRSMEDELAHQKEFNRKLELRFSTVQKINEEKYQTRLKALISDHTQKELSLQTELDLLKAKMGRKIPEIEPKAEPPRTNLKPRNLYPPKTPTKEEKKNEFKELGGFMEAEPEELVPMIKTALDHGDSEEQIRQTLITSGYKREIVDSAILKVSKAQSN